MEERLRIEGQADAPAAESEDEQSDAETGRGRPMRARQPRRIYTYDELGQPTFQLLKICAVSGKESPRSGHDPSTRSSYTYPFL